MIMTICVFERKGTKIQANDKIKPQHLCKTKPRFTTVLLTE